MSTKAKDPLIVEVGTDALMVKLTRDEREDRAKQALCRSQPRASPRRDPAAGRCVGGSGAAVRAGTERDRTMNIMDLDEAEGLTDEMVCQYLRASPVWRPRSSGAMFCDTHAGRSRLVWPSAVARDLAGTICDIAHAEQRSPQAILREMNPRLAPWPSAEARQAHPGFWLAVDTENGVAAMGKFRPDVAWFSHSQHILTEDDTFAKYWPCDAHGNKLRYPAVSDAT